MGSEIASCQRQGIALQLRFIVDSDRALVVFWEVLWD
jgi:hypothetical protein